MRPVDKGGTPLNDEGIPKVYTDYKYARRDLIEKLGEFCSYCESRLPASLAVEHVRPKSLNPELEREWENFLLSCTNCNSNKGDKEVALGDFLWPDRDNTFHHLVYRANGIIEACEHATDLTRKKVNNLLDLVQLNRLTPSAGTLDYAQASDRRYENRLAAFISARDVLDEYENAPEVAKPYIISSIVKLVAAGGFWSVWMTVFSQHPEIRCLLIQEIVGTCRNCFDATGETVDLSSR